MPEGVIKIFKASEKKINQSFTSLLHIYISLIRRHFLTSEGKQRVCTKRLQGAATEREKRLFMLTRKFLDENEAK